MVRTQIQLTEEQAARLKRLAAAQGRSMADLIREGVDRLVGEDADACRRDRMMRAVAAFGRFRSGRHDLASEHDAQFAEASARR